MQNNKQNILQFSKPAPLTAGFFVTNHRTIYLDHHPENFAREIRVRAQTFPETIHL